VRVEITSVGIDRGTGAHYVLLEDRTQRRSLPILIGDNEAQAIMLAMHGLRPPRPLTQDLLRSVIKETGSRVDRIEISDMHDEVYFAKIILEGGHTVDSRPSDAIALAMGTNAPIFVNEKLLTADAGLGLGSAAYFPRSARGLGITVQDLTPELATYFGLRPRSGVLVAEVADRAKSAGIARGDVVTRIDGKDIGDLSDFDRELTALKGSDAPVTVTVTRDKAARSITIAPQQPARN